MECVDLRTGYMLLAFRSQKEVERAKTLCETRGMKVACALAYAEVTEKEAADFVQHVPHEGRNMFCNYGKRSSGDLCPTAKASLGSALHYVNALNGFECEYLLVYEKEEPLLQGRVAEQVQPGQTFV